jgi:hypothetical protein
MNTDENLVLLIGCGEIGALMDINISEIQTHLKALTFLGFKKIDVFDHSFENISKAKTKYVFNHVEEINFELYDLVIIASATSSHFSYLKDAMSHHVKIILCEKPISLNVGELSILKSISQTSTSKVYINYIRQFIPEFQSLKEYFDLRKSLGDEINQITVTYTRGLINNCSHAFNLIQFYSEFYTLDQVLVSNITAELNNDPTISCSFILDEKIHTNVVGLGHSKYNYFEIIFYLSSSVVKIQDSGDDISIFEIPENRPTSQYKSKLNFNNSKSGKGVIKDYMLSVYNYILSDGKDNLNESILINQKLIEISHLCQS